LSTIKENTRRHQSGLPPTATAFHVVDTMPITDSKVFLANNETKDSLTLYLVDKAIQLKIPMVSVMRLHVQSNMEDSQPSTGVSKHEEADTLMMLHAAEICATGKSLHMATHRCVGSCSAQTPGSWSSDDDVIGNWRTPKKSVAKTNL